MASEDLRTLPLPSAGKGAGSGSGFIQRAEPALLTRAPETRNNICQGKQVPGGSVTVLNRPSAGKKSQSLREYIHCSPGKGIHMAFSIGSKKRVAF